MKLNYEKGEEGYKASKELKIKRVKTHYPELFPLGISKEELDEVWNEISDIDFTKNQMIFCKKDLLKSVMLYGFLSLEKFVEYDFISLYRLLDIFFDKDENFVSLNQLDKDYLILYGGFGDIRNDMLHELINQVIEQRVINNKCTWFYYKNSWSIFKSRFGDVAKLLKSRNFNRTDLNIRRSKSTSNSINMDIGEDF